MKIALVSHTVIAEDPRIRRHGDALAAAGHDVIGIGVPGSRVDAPTWPVLELAAPVTPAALRRVATLGAVRVGLADPEKVYWQNQSHHALVDVVVSAGADVVVANDWPVLPAVGRAAEISGVGLVYDSREYGIGEHSERWRWRLLYPPWISAIERRWASRAAAVMTVSEGIALLLQADIGLERRPAVVRNMPPWSAPDDHSVGDVVHVLYQGLYAPDRGLDTLVQAGALLPDHVRLELRGHGPAAYVERLHRLADGSGGKATVSGPVPADQMVASARSADVGVHPIPGVSPQTKLCLPNKLFEYVMAGLAVCVSDAPEMARVVREHDLGVVWSQHTPKAIAAALASMTPELVEHHRVQARAAGPALSWDQEQVRLLKVFDQLERQA